MTCPKCGAAIQPQPYIQADPSLSPKAYCILCGRSGRETGKMIIGMHGGICPECVELAAEIIHKADSDQPTEPPCD